MLPKVVREASAPVGATDRLTVISADSAVTMTGSVTGNDDGAHSRDADNDRPFDE
jgi:hypothetical protein